MAGPALPDFVNHPGVIFPILPQGIHDANLSEVEAKLVDALPNPQRLLAFNGWVAFRALVHALVPVRGEYINGSFVTAKPNPKDVDVSFWIDADDLDALDPARKGALNQLFGVQAPNFHVDAYVVPECGFGHASYATFQFMLWTEHFWSRCRDHAGAVIDAHGIRKGFVRVVP
jgi:hypothetical protein